MINLLGAGLIVLSLSLMGDLKARSFLARVRHLQQFQQGLRLLVTEVSYTATLLPYALLSIGKRLDAPVGELFSRAGNLLLKKKDLSAKEAWTKMLEDNRYMIELNERDLAIIRQLGNTLGNFDTEGQIKQIELTLKQLEYAISEAEDKRRENERMWRYLGFLGGLVLVILFL
ncbi:MAG: stage III sporulation protein SpoIIIAB [Dethiobacteria bacterium]|jgi:stage III sporulation protein AB